MPQWKPSLETKARRLQDKIHDFREAMPDNEEGVSNHHFRIACSLLGNCVEIIQEMGGEIERLGEELRSHKRHDLPIG